MAKSEQRKQKWQKIGWRSLRHNDEPKFIVRFARSGVITNVKGIDWGLPLPPILVEAKAQWALLKMKEGQ